MADLCLQTPSTSTEEMESDNPAVENPDGCSKVKKLKPSDENELLEERLNEILCCAVCLDLPKTAAFQVIITLCGFLQLI